MNNRYLFLIGTLLMGYFCVQGQSNSSSIFAEPPQHGWYTFRSELNLDPLQVFSQYKSAFGMGPQDEMHLLKTTYDEMGFSHYHYQLFHQGIPVEHAQVRVHARNGRAEKANGLIPALSPVSIIAFVAPDQTILAAQAFVNAKSYMWDYPEYDSLRQMLKKDPEATYFPDPKLVITDTDFDWKSPDYLLAYRLDIFTAEPLGGQRVYIDAQTGAVIKSLDLMQHEDRQGTAETRYSGTRQIIADSTATHFRLREAGRAANGIITLDLNGSTFLPNAVDFTDDDNYWNNFNAQWDEVATDVHWGVEMTYDYYLQQHGWDSYDGKGGTLLSYVHYNGPAYSNAFWLVDFAGYGDGSGFPVVDIDIVGHEITHGVVRNTADLIYIDEGAALNEGFADIFGNCAQYFADSSTFSWRVSEFSGTIRSMADPNALGDPDTYKGNFWYTGPFDNGGAHTNGNVLAYWFYLLANGGAGVNDKGDAYTVTGIGIEKAGAIAFRTLSVYLTPTSLFEDAWRGALESAEDMYGVCSQEFLQTVNAWYAVGFGQPIRNNDIGVVAVEPIEACGLTDAEAISIRIKNFGCDSFPSGSLTVTLRIKPSSFFKAETVSLPNGLGPNEELIYTFSNLADLSVPGDHIITAKTLFAGDSVGSNNESPELIVPVRSSLSQGPLHFESNMSSIMDSLVLSSGSDAAISISPGSGFENSTGLMMEGGEGARYRFVESYPLWGGPPVDVFDFNPDFSAKACMCVDGASYSKLELTFRLKQTFSSFFKFRFAGQFPGEDLDSIMSTQGSNLRVLVDGTELARFHPTTQANDTFALHTFDLTDYVGSAFQVCFEGKNVNSQALDLDTLQLGDRVMLDNISLSGWTVDNEPDLETSLSFSLYPNPNQGRFDVAYRLDEPKDLVIQIHDLQGRLLQTSAHARVNGEGLIPFHLESLPSGMYLMTIQAGSQTLTRKVLKE